ncbi:MAG: GNAT family N-acetyltransferase [Bacteroidota bacterium]
MKIINSNLEDIDEIYRLYDIAIEYQKERFHLHWPVFKRSLIETEINENRQWKIMKDNNVACVFAITFEDPHIWEEKNIDKAIYIHRIAVNPDYRGENFVNKIVKWAKIYAKSMGKDYLRLDTVGDNKKLLEHYRKNGFNFLGMVMLKNSKDLPRHYHNVPVSLFEMKLNNLSENFSRN